MFLGEEGLGALYSDVEHQDPVGVGSFLIGEVWS